MKKNALVLERLLAASPERVWNALTRKEEMKEWYFELSAFKAEPGFTFSFNGGDETKTYLHQCRVTEVIPQRKLQYTWKYPGFPGESLLSFELIPQGANTLLRVTHEGLDSFPQDNPDFARENFSAGWNHIIGKSLPDYLAEETAKP